MFDMMCAKDLDDNYCMADPANAQMFDSGDSGGENIANRRKVVDIKKKWRKGAAAGKTNTPRHYLAARRGSRRNGGPPPFASVDSDGDGCISQTEAEVIGFDSGDFAPVAGDSGSPCGDRVSPEEYAAANAGNDDDSSDDDHDGNNNNGDPPLHVMCSVCGMKMMQAITMFEDEQAPSSAQMKSMCYKKNNTYCGDYITGVKGNVPWDHMTRDCGAPEDPWTRPLPPGTWCSATCKTTITAMNSSWGCCAMTLAIAHDVEFSEYLRRQASSCGVSFVQPCQGGDPLKFTIQVANLKCDWVSEPANRPKFTSLVAADIATYFGVLKSRVTVEVACIANSSGTSITSNMEFPSQAQSDKVKTLFSSARRTSSAQDLSLYSLDMLPASAKINPEAPMPIKTSATVEAGEVVAAVATLYVPPTKSTSTFCEDTSAVSVCSSEVRATVAITSDQCFKAAGLYASSLTGCSSVNTKSDVTVACKTALGGSSTCFGAAPVALPGTSPFIVPPATSSGTHVVKMAVSLPMTINEFTLDKQTKFMASIAAAAGVSSDDVAIDDITSIPTSSRRLLEASIRVDTSVKAKDKSSADALGAKLTTNSINSELAKLGLPPATMLVAPATVSTIVSTATLFRSSFAVIITAALVAIAALYY